MIKKKINLEQGNRLRECLKDKRMSQKELSEKSDYTPQHINNIINGKRNMSQDSAEIFANILEVRKEYLLCRDNFKTLNSATKYVCNQLDNSNDAIIALLNFVGIHIIGSIMECKSGDTFTLTSIPKICVSQKLFNGAVIKICGELQIPKSIKIYTEVNGIKKEIPQENLYNLYKDIINYTRFRCNEFKDKYFLSKE